MIHLDDDTIKRLRLLQRKHKDKRVYIKSTVLLMLYQGFTTQMIAESLGIDDSTVYRYHQGFEELGLDDYLKDFFVAYSGQLTGEEEALLKSEIREGLYINVLQICDGREFQHKCSFAELNFQIPQNYLRSTKPRLLQMCCYRQFCPSP